MHNRTYHRKRSLIWESVDFIGVRRINDVENVAAVNQTDGVLSRLVIAEAKGRTRCPNIEFKTPKSKNPSRISIK